ncbi:MAG: hypothetical protein JEY99_04225 [Spirochaetales bacterium]|nr:hypothetical protein [Spirochaetales bacterium]
MKNYKLITFSAIFIISITACVSRPPVGDPGLSERLLDVSSSVITVDIASSDPHILSMLNDVFPENFREQILPDTDKFILLLYPESTGGGFILISQGDYTKNKFNMGLFFKRNWKFRSKPVSYWDSQDSNLELTILSPELMIFSDGHIVEAVQAVKAISAIRPSRNMAASEGDSHAALPLAPLSLRLKQPELFLTSLSGQYPELAAGIKGLSLEIYPGDLEISLNGTILCEDSAFAEMAVRPFKIMILAEAKKSGMALMRKTLADTRVETEGAELHFSDLPMESKRFISLVEGMLSGVKP